MKIDGIYVSCYKDDFHLTRLCVASIRFWYPDVAVWLIKDEKYGRFDTLEIERHWNVRVHAANNPRKFGWGMGKLEVLLLPGRSRCLLLDSDIVFAGRVLDEIGGFAEDFVVPEERFDSADIGKLYYELPKLKQLDPGFEFPGYCFNTGPVLATTGLLCREDFSPYVDWNTSQVRLPEVFKMAEQGLLNYIVQRKVQHGEMTLRRQPFMVWPGEPGNSKHIQVGDFTPEGRRRELIHWAGLRWGKTLERMPRPDILLHFEKLYYSRVPFGSWIRGWRRGQIWAASTLVAPCKKAARRILSKPH